MSEDIILYNGPTSPFGRKCKIAALLLEIEHKEDLQTQPLQQEIQDLGQMD